MQTLSGRATCSRLCIPDTETGNRESMGSILSSLFNRLFLVPKPNNKWRPILDLYRYKLSQVVSPVRDLKAWTVDALTLSWEDLDLYTFARISQGDQIIGSFMQESHSDSPRLAKHAVVFGPGESVIQNTYMPSQPTQFVKSTLNRVLYRDLLN